MKSGEVKGAPDEVPDDGGPGTRPDGRRDRWKAHRAERRREFVDAAIAAIRAVGPRISLDDVCAQAKVTKPVLYRHFRDKDDLHRAVLDQVATHLVIPRITGELARVHGDDRDLLRAAIGAYVALVREERDLYRYAMAHNGLGDGGDFVGSVEASIAGAVGMLLTARQDEPADDAETVAFGIVGMVQLATNRWLDRPTVSEESLMTTLTELAWTGLAPRVEGARTDATD
ncbi:TetR/AcrR family transcriptional regulator [Pedococcus sp. KACC 23699]|uniref:TetR/AcrR family transcriptional regulator n=1 Tax=Pedococcus sp. KACC 23699 TaxID=3149228 RepID=A0AAU7JX41_9MICO